MTIAATSSFGLGCFPEHANGTTALSLTALAPSQLVLFTFDGSADRIAWIGRIPKTGTLTEVLFRTGTVSTAGATFQIQLETVGSTGLPSGTPYTANANGTVVVSTTDDNVWKTVSINSGTGVTVTRGDEVAIVLTVSSGTPNTVQISGPTTHIMQFTNYPYLVTDTGGGTFVKSAAAIIPNFMLNYGGTFAYAPSISPINAIAATTVGNGNERALRFSLPFPMSVAGLRVLFSNVAAGADFRLRIYDSTPTLLTGAEINAGADADGDSMGGATVDAYGDFFFPSDISLSANTVYYASVYQRTATNLAVVDFSVTSSAHLGAAPGGSEFYLGTRSGGTGTFTDTDTTRPFIHLIPAGFDDATGGGGGGLTQPNLRGNMQL